MGQQPDPNAPIHVHDVPPCARRLFDPRQGSLDRRNGGALLGEHLFDNKWDGYHSFSLVHLPRSAAGGGRRGRPTTASSLAMKRSLPRG